MTGLIESRLTGGLIQTLRLIEKQGGRSMYDVSEDHWSLLKLSPMKQRSYMELLKEHYPGIQSYFPVFRRLVRSNGHRRPKEVVRPVYPGYVFLKVGAGSIRGPTELPVVARWVRFGGNIEAIPDFVIEKLRSLEASNELVREVRYVNPFYRGVRVAVNLEYADVQSTVVRLAGNGRIIVDTPLGRATVPVHKCRVL